LARLNGQLTARRFDWAFGQLETVELELDVTGLYVGEGEDILHFEFVANTSSLLLKAAISNASLSLAHKSQLLLLGQASEASYYDNITAETVNFTQVFEV